jgi:hypothetical protein
LICFLMISLISSALISMEEFTPSVIYLESV